MLVAVDPLLHRIESLPEHGCYSVTFLVERNQERSVVMKVVEREVVVPEANMLAGWSRGSAAFEAIQAAVGAVDQARTVTDGSGAVLRDVPGGWDVGVGNIVLGTDGQPECVAHGPLDLTAPATYSCATCAAQALFGEPV